MTREEYQQLIRERATALGVDPEYMLRVAQSESGFNPSIGSDTGAKGLFQFMPATWKSYLSKYGQQYGYTADTPPTDPVANTTMAALYTKESTDLHKQKYGRTPTRGELYTYHFLGPTAQSVFSAEPTATVDTVIPKIYNSSPTNKAALSNKDGTPLTVAQFLQRMETKAGGTKKMAEIPNMLEMPRPALGDTAAPAPFYADAPPANQDEFTARYQEALGFLKSPEWKAAALQMAIAAIQPRAPGQSVLGHLANAVGEGASAAGRAGMLAEGDRRQQVKEAQQAEELGLKREQIAGQQRIQEGQLQLQKGQLSIQEATLKRMDEQSQLAWKRLDLDRDRMDKEMLRIDAQMKAAEGRERVSLLQNIGKMRTDLIKNAQERLQLLHPEKNKAEYESVQAEIARHQSELERITGEYEKAIQAVSPGALPPKPAATTLPEVTLDNEKFMTWAKANPDKMREATTTGISIGGRMVKIKPTEDQMQMLEDAGRVVPRGAGTLGEKAQERATTGMDMFSTLIGGMPPRRKAQGPDKIREAGGLSDEEWSKLGSQEKAQRRETLSQLLPDKPPVDAPTWQAILESPQARKAAVALYGEKRVAQAERDLKDMAPRRGKATKREDALKKALE